MSPESNPSSRSVPGASETGTALNDVLGEVVTPYLDYEVPTIEDYDRLCQLAAEIIPISQGTPTLGEAEEFNYNGPDGEILDSVLASQALRLAQTDWHLDATSQKSLTGALNFLNSADNLLTPAERVKAYIMEGGSYTPEGLDENMTPEDAIAEITRIGFKRLVLSNTLAKRGAAANS